MRAEKSQDWDPVLRKYIRTDALETSWQITLSLLNFSLKKEKLMFEYKGLVSPKHKVIRRLINNYKYVNTLADTSVLPFRNLTEMIKQRSAPAMIFIWSIATKFCHGAFK